jgi:hypothetical protein
VREARLIEFEIRPALGQTFLFDDPHDAELVLGRGFDAKADPGQILEAVFEGAWLADARTQNEPVFTLVRPIARLGHPAGMIVLPIARSPLILIPRICAEDLLRLPSGPAYQKESRSPCTAPSPSYSQHGRDSLVSMVQTTGIA